MTKDEFTLDWATTFEDLKYKSAKRGGNDTEFGTCLKCLRKTYKNFDEKEMLREGKKQGDRKSTRLNSSHSQISYAVFCLKKKGGHGRHLAGPPPCGDADRGHARAAGGPSRDARGDRPVPDRPGRRLVPVRVFF